MKNYYTGEDPDSLRIAASIESFDTVIIILFTDKSSSEIIISKSGIIEEFDEKYVQIFLGPDIGFFCTEIYACGSPIFRLENAEQAEVILGDAVRVLLKLVR